MPLPAEEDLWNGSIERRPERGYRCVPNRKKETPMGVLIQLTLPEAAV
jgi:hypothetical protein